MAVAIAAMIILGFTASGSIPQAASEQGKTVPVTHNQPDSRSSLSASQVFTRARSSVVVIVANDEKGQEEAQGSGFIVSRNTIVTNHHVVQGMKEAYILFSDGKVAQVSGVLADSPERDLILLRVDTDGRAPLPIGDELSLHQGDVVYALGAPRGLELSLTNGIVSSFRDSSGQFLIQNTAPISHGSSGGPLFDDTGRVVGITSSMLADSAGIYFSIGIGDVKRLLRTPDAVTLPFEEWAAQSKNQQPSDLSEPDAANEKGTIGEIKQIEDFLHDKKFDQAKAALASFAAKNPGSPFGLSLLLRHTAVC